MTRQVRVQKVFNAPGFPQVYEVQARRRWQTEWTTLRVYAAPDKELAKQDADATRERVFTDEEKEMMKGAL